MARKYLLFDLDGTLTDPALGITNAIIHALVEMGVEVPPREELHRFIGPPLHKAFGEFFEGEAIDEAVRTYRAYYREKGLFENHVYDGIPEALRILREHGYVLAVATSKPEEFAVKILRHFGLEEYFTVIGGATFDVSRSEKRQVIEYVLAKLGASPEECIMIGDRIYDMEGAASLGMAAIGVLWGYGSAEEFSSAEKIAATPAELAEILGAGE